MIRFIISRVLQLIPILFVVSIIVFGLLRFGPVDPAYAYLVQSRIPPTDEALAETRKELGLDKPVVEQYIIWLKKAVQLDFGISYSTKRPAFDDILYYLPTTLKLAFSSMLFVMLLSIPLGVLGALRKDKLTEKFINLFSFAGVSIPSFWLGFLLIYFFSIKLELLPPIGNDTIIHYIMPVITLSIMSVAINTRLTKTSVLEHMNNRYVYYARARGIPEKKIIFKHVLKNSMIPVVTSFGMHFGELIGGAVIVETLFAWPGVGRYAVSAIYAHDYPIIQCFMLMMTILFVFTNLLTDILYAWINPKIRYGNK